MDNQSVIINSSFSIVNSSLTDTHTHLYYKEEGLEGRNAVVERAIAAGVSRMFLPGVDAASMADIFELAAAYPENCFPMLGLHPCSVKENFEEELRLIKTAMDQNKIYAVGEIGIDLYWDKTYLPQQIEAFRRQISWAKELNLPINIHCRNAFEETMKVLREEQDDRLRGIFHCFGGTLEEAKQILEVGLLLGIGGVVTYKNAGLDKVVAQLRPEDLVLETDSPYLSPVPHRGKPNQSAYLVHIAQKVADLLQMDIQGLAEVTTHNSWKIYGR